MQTFKNKTAGFIIITPVVVDQPVMALNVEVDLHIPQMEVVRLRNVLAGQTVQMVRDHLVKHARLGVRNRQLK